MDYWFKESMTITLLLYLAFFPILYAIFRLSYPVRLEFLDNGILLAYKYKKSVKIDYDEIVEAWNWSPESRTQKVQLYLRNSKHSIELTKNDAELFVNELRRLGLKVTNQYYGQENE